ncbi:1274_t:CDS:2, partial [Cetraspora pellucida]
MAISFLVPGPSVPVRQHTSEIAKQPNSSSRRLQPVSADMKMGALCSMYIRNCLANQGLLEKAIRLYKATYDKGFTKTVSLNIKKCQIEASRAYNTIAGYRLVISEVYDWMNNTPIGSHPIIVKVMRGVYNKNLPLPTDDEIVNLVPAFDKVQFFGNNNAIDILSLLRKVSFLLSITIASRTSNLIRINASFMVLTAHEAMFSIRSLKKHKISLAHGSNKLALKKIYVRHYSELPEISPLDTSSKLPAPDTVARWIKDMLYEASPDLKAKDARSLAAFYGQSSGTDLSTIL